MRRRCHSCFYLEGTPWREECRPTTAELRWPCRSPESLSAKCVGRRPKWLPARGSPASNDGEREVFQRVQVGEQSGPLGSATAMVPVLVFLRRGNGPKIWTLAAFWHVSNWTYKNKSDSCWGVWKEESKFTGPKNKTVKKFVSILDVFLSCMVLNSHHLTCCRYPTVIFINLYTTVTVIPAEILWRPCRKCFVLRRKCYSL